MCVSVCVERGGAEACGGWRKECFVVGCGVKAVGAWSGDGCNLEYGLQRELLYFNNAGARNGGQGQLLMVGGEK